MRTHRTHTTKRPTSDVTAQHPMVCITTDNNDNDTFLCDDSDLLLFAASALLSRHAPSSDDDCVALPPGVDLSSFQALLQAATSAVTTEPAAKGAGSKVKASPVRSYARTAHTPTAAALPSAYAKKRRERNRLSCRKTRLKRKAEQARALLVVRKRDEHNEFLSALHREATTRELETREKARLARHLVVRSLHFGLMDPTYDASWCIAVPTRPTTDNVCDDMASQWQAIAAAFAVADLSILQIHDDRPDEVACMWCASGTPTSGEQFQDDNDNDNDNDNGHEPAWRSVTGTTRMRFHGQLVASVEMRVADCGAFAVAV